MELHVANWVDERGREFVSPQFKPIKANLEYDVPRWNLNKFLLDRVSESSWIQKNSIVLSSQFLCCCSPRQWQDILHYPKCHTSASMSTSPSLYCEWVVHLPWLCSSWRWALLSGHSTNHRGRNKETLCLDTSTFFSPRFTACTNPRLQLVISLWSYFCRLLLLLLKMHMCVRKERVSGSSLRALLEPVDWHWVSFPGSLVLGSH